MIDDSPDRGPVERGSIIARVILGRPDAERVLYEEFGLPCYDCPAVWTETIETGMCLTGIDPDVVVARLEQCPLGPEQSKQSEQSEQPEQPEQ